MNENKCRSILCVLLLLASPAFPQAGVYGPQQTVVKGAVFRCKVICVACELQKKYGVGGHAKDAAHTVAIETLDGLIFTVLPGVDAKPLLTEASWMGKTLDLNGRTFPKAMVVEVFRFKPIDPAQPEVRQLTYYCYI